MRPHEYVDQFILEEIERLGGEYALEDYRAWLEAGYPERAHKASSDLVEHRQHPDQRVFTTECFRYATDARGRTYETVGMGPTARYRVVETAGGVRWSSLLRIHLREAEEMVGRWENEARYRMIPIQMRDRRARAAFVQAIAEVKAAATTLHARLRLIDELGEEE